MIVWQLALVPDKSFDTPNDLVKKNLIINCQNYFGVKIMAKYPLYKGNFFSVT